MFRKTTLLLKPEFLDSLLEFLPPGLASVCGFDGILLLVGSDLGFSRVQEMPLYTPSDLLSFPGITNF